VPNRGWFLRKSKDFFASSSKVLRDATMEACYSLALPEAEQG
jgi:hypothetical protein